MKTKVSQSMMLSIHLKEMERNKGNKLENRSSDEPPPSYEEPIKNFQV